MAYPTLYVLLKNHSKSGLVKFHGVAGSSDVARAWQNAGISNWFYEIEADGSSVVASLPITFDRMNNGEIE